MSFHPAPTPGGASFVMFTEPPGIDELVAVLRTALDDVTVTDGDAAGAPLESPVISGRMGPDTVLVAPVGAPLPPGEAEAACHPVWWDDPAPVSTHAAHAIVVARSEGDDLDDPRTHALRQALSTSTAAAALAGLPVAVAVHASGAGATFPAAEYRAYIAAAREQQRLPVGVWVTTWLDPNDDGTVAGHTQGLVGFGHADLDVAGSHRDPSDVYTLLASLADHILMTGEHLDPGHTLGWNDGVHAVTAAPDSTPTHPVLAIDF